MKKIGLFVVITLILTMIFNTAIGDSIEDWDPFGKKRSKFENEYYVATLPEGNWDAYPDKDSGATYYYGDKGNLLFLTQEIPITEKEMNMFTYSAFYETFLQSALGDISEGLFKEDISINNHPAILFTYQQSTDGMLVNSAGAIISIDGHVLGVFYRDLLRDIKDLKNEVIEICDSIKYKKETKTTSKTSLSLKTSSINKKEYSQLPYKKVLRNPTDYVGKKYYIKGKIFQEIVEDENTIGYLIATEKTEYLGYTDGYVLVAAIKENSAFPFKERPLEDDIVSVYGISMGDYTYKTALGIDNRVPALYAEWIDITK